MQKGNGEMSSDQSKHINILSKAPTDQGGDMKPTTHGTCEKYQEERSSIIGSTKEAASKGEITNTYILEKVRSTSNANFGKKDGVGKPGVANSCTQETREIME